VTAARSAAALVVAGFATILAGVAILAGVRAWVILVAAGVALVLLGLFAVDGDVDVDREEREDRRRPGR
jgi:fatty acid desaturase